MPSRRKAHPWDAKLERSSSNPCSIGKVATVLLSEFSCVPVGYASTTKKDKLIAIFKCRYNAQRCMLFCAFSFEMKMNSTRFVRKNKRCQTKYCQELVDNGTIPMLNLTLLL